MRKRNLAIAFAVLAIAGAVVPMTANAGVKTAKPFNIASVSGEIHMAWGRNFDYGAWAKNVEISRKENESEYDYYNRLRDYVASYWTITTEVPTTVARATEMKNEHKVDNDHFYRALGSLMYNKSDLRWYTDTVSTEIDTDGGYCSGGGDYTRYKEMVNEYGQKQTIPSMVEHSCEHHEIWEKGVFGIVQLDGKLYAMKMTADSATCGTLIPYEELGYKNCDFTFGWNTNLLTARGYQGMLVKSIDEYIDVDIYDADGSYDFMTAYKTEKQWVVQGILLYYCEDGKITPMTKALHDTLQKNNTHVYDPASGASRTIPNGWKLFAE